MHLVGTRRLLTALFAIRALVEIVNKTVDLCSRLARQRQVKAEGYAQSPESAY